jgi:hypothetical protein
MAITTLPPSPAGEIDHNTVREKINEVIADVNVKTVTQVSLGSFESQSNQSPTGAGQSGAITIDFGAGGSTTGSEFTVDGAGIVTCNMNSIQYDFEVTLRIARSGSSSNSEIMARMMYAPDGINYAQAGSTFGVMIDDDDTVWRENFSLKFSPAVGSKLFIELARNNGASNSGGLGSFQPSGDLSSWNAINTASLEIFKTVVDEP